MKQATKDFAGMAAITTTIRRSSIFDDFEASAAGQIESLAHEDREIDTSAAAELATPHPHGVRPSGNGLFVKQNDSDNMGLFNSLPDWIVLAIVEYCDARTLIKLSHTCKAFWAYCNHDPLWREMALSKPRFSNQWQGNWKSTYLDRPSYWNPQVSCGNMYSDVLFRHWQCGHITWKHYRAIPRTNSMKEYSELSRAEFLARASSRPFVLRGGCRKWRVFDEWSSESLLERYGNVKFRAEAVDWSYRNYDTYMKSTQEESPLYLFDRAFVEKMNLSIGPTGAYEVPPVFSEDYFQVLGKERPDHRWLIIGPAGSGSTFHKDPNGTSAWNAVVSGSKYWIMFPNSIAPPGVHVNEDQSEVTSPLSVGEWLLTCHQEARQTAGCVEEICRAGDIVYVPAGWWHLVVNLEPTIAITQNFVSQHDLRPVINFLKNKSDQVSGFRKSVVDPYAYFMAKLRENHPATYEVYMANCQAAEKRKWENIVQSGEAEEPERAAFSFGFGGDSEDENDNQ